jgi:hypothetical protein
VALVSACTVESTCADPITLPQSWTSRVDSCPGVRVHQPGADECWQSGYRNDGCEMAQHYWCANGVELTVSVNSADGTGNFVVRDGATGCESRWTLEVADGR